MTTIMATLTIQYKRIKGGWEDRTIVTVFNPSVLEAEIVTLVAELPDGIAARVKVEINNVISYRW
jgi:hypothetical protein